MRGLDLNLKAVNTLDVMFLEPIHLQRSFACRLRRSIVLLLICIAITIPSGGCLSMESCGRNKTKKEEEAGVRACGKYLGAASADQLGGSGRSSPSTKCKTASTSPETGTGMRPVWEQAVQLANAVENVQYCKVWRRTWLPTSPGSSATPPENLSNFVN